MLSNILRKFQSTFHPVVPFNAGEDKLLKMDFTLANKDLTSTLLNDTNKFAAYMEHLLQKANANMVLAVITRTGQFIPAAKL